VSALDQAIAIAVIAARCDRDRQRIAPRRQPVNLVS
jgi:hypothetical protein